MTETGIIALMGIIATFVGTLAAGLGATALANSHSRKQSRAARAHAVQDEVRTLIVTILTEGRAWQSATTTTSMVIATADNLAAVDAYISKDFSDSWTGKTITESGAALDRAVTEARILIRDPALREAIVTLGQLRAAWWSEVIDPIRDLFKGGERDKVARLRPLWKWEAQWKRGIEAMEQRATEIIATSLAPDARPRPRGLAFKS